MAKIQRKTQKIFAGNTTADQITAFGTAKTVNPVYTTDLDVIQTNVYTQGWAPSLMSDLAPYLQDSNALWYLVTTQLAYLFQQGISEWDAGTEYVQGSVVSKYNNGELEFYMSLQNGNTNHQLNETGYWKKYSFYELINNINNKVSKSGDTLTGDLTIQKTNSATCYNGKNSALKHDSTNTGGNVIYGNYLRTLDPTTGAVIGQTGTFLNQYNIMASDMVVSRNIGGQTHTAAIQVVINGDGFAYVNAPVPVLKRTYINGFNGYRVWTDGFCQQWGISSNVTAGSQINLLRTYKDTNYSIFLQPTGVTQSSISGWSYVATPYAYTNNKFNVYTDRLLGGLHWLACGYLPAGTY